MSQKAAMSQNPVVDRFLDAVCRGRIDGGEIWAPDATLDATVPNWRFRRVGVEQIRATYRTWFADPGRFERLRRSPVEGGEIVEYLLQWTEGGVPHAAHHMHWLDIVGDRITADLVLCGGRWPAPLLAEMAAEMAAELNTPQQLDADEEPNVAVANSVEVCDA